VAPDLRARPELTEPLLFGPLLPPRYRLDGPGPSPRDERSGRSSLARRVRPSTRPTSRRWPGRADRGGGSRTRGSLTDTLSDACAQRSGAGATCAARVAVAGSPREGRGARRRA
jgi:hypothetical protein